jgi:hypothetical protein
MDTKLSAINIFINNSIVLNNLTIIKNLYSNTRLPRLKIIIIDYLYYKNIANHISTRIQELERINENELNDNDYQELNELHDELRTTEMIEWTYIDNLIELGLDEETAYNIDDTVFFLNDIFNKVSVLSKTYNTIIQEIYI